MEDDFTQDELITRERFTQFIDWRKKCGKDFHDLEYTPLISKHDAFLISGQTGYKLAIEIKTRQLKLKTFPTLLIEKDKYDHLMSLTGVARFYINFLADAIVVFDLDKLPAPKWITETHIHKTRNQALGKIQKQVGYLPINQALHTFSATYIKTHI